MAKLIKVQGTGKDNKVVLWERNENHPNGQAFIANNGEVVEVFETPKVRQALAEGRLTTEVKSEEASRKVGRPRKEETEGGTKE